MEKFHLAIDIGASSGRHILGWIHDGKIIQQEIYRFDNGIIEKDGHLCWNIDHLISEIIAGLCICHEKNIIPKTIGVDTWAVDYVLLDRSQQRIGNCISYRDSRTENTRQDYENIIPFGECYRRTGIQYQKFNTLYQLLAQKKEYPSQLKNAETFLMIPDYVNYLLTGIQINEYTNATTTGMVNAETSLWDEEIIESADLPRHIFKKIGKTGTSLGHLTERMKKTVGFDAEVILTASHDTGSAFLAAPADKNSIILSSGTWSLMGVENRKAIIDKPSMIANFTNEGGYEYRYRYLKNIMGLWMLQKIRRENLDSYGNYASFQNLSCEAKTELAFPSLVNVDDKRFIAPVSMSKEIREACRENGQPVPQNRGELLAVVYHSLAKDYSETYKLLKKLTGRKFKRINIVGGGCRDKLLNTLCAEETGLKVCAGPVEATALGNLIVQWIASGELKNIECARKMISESYNTGLENINEL